jgi:hypothetical protein
MSEADKMIHQYQFVPGPSAVQPVLDRSSTYYDATNNTDRAGLWDGETYIPSDQPPEWLAKYMETINKHDSEKAMVRQLRHMR